MSTASQVGSPASGNSEPDRNIIGMTSICIIGMNAWNCLIRAAIITPNAVR